MNTDVKNGTSLAMRQWVKIVRGEVEAHKEWNEFPVTRVQAVERYCLHCCDVRTFDVIMARDGNKEFVWSAKCRSCGEE